MSALPERSETMTQATTVDGSSPERTPSNEKRAPSSGGDNADGDPSKAPQGPIEKDDALERAFQYPAAAVVEALGSDETQGLSDAEAKRRPEEYGANQLEGGDEISKLQILIHQVANAMTLVSLRAECAAATHAASGGCQFRRARRGRRGAATARAMPKSELRGADLARWRAHLTRAHLTARRPQATPRTPRAQRCSATSPPPAR